MGTAIGEEDGKMMGDRLGGMGMANASKIINAQGYQHLVVRVSEEMLVVRVPMLHTQ